MIRLSLKRYSFILTVQFLFLLVDLGINSFAYLARNDKFSVILVFVVQDVCLLLSFSIIILNLYSTYIYQAGLADLLLHKFRTTIGVLILYFLLCISHHIWIVIDHHKTPYSFQWPKTLTALYIIQRLTSPLYYYLYKRSALRMSDPRFYENMDWITEQLAIK